MYANISRNPRQDTWRHFFQNNQVSSRNRPWMPAAGNHENELNNGPFGYLAYQTRFALPTTARGTRRYGVCGIRSRPDRSV